MTTPLTDAGLDPFDDFLMRDDAPENTMDTSMLDGYLAAVASGPNLIMPDQMLRWVWLFWGDDRLEDAIEWSLNGRLSADNSPSLPTG